MNQEIFESLATKLLDHAAEVRGAKAKEYATNDDRLSNFRKAAALATVTMPEAVAGMMVKHTVSIYDMVNASFKETLGAYPESLWLEKLGDQINYLLLIYAAIIESGRLKDNVEETKK